MKQLLIRAQDQKKMNKIIEDEAEALVQAWLDPEFNAKISAFWQTIENKKKVKKNAKL